MARVAVKAAVRRSAFMVVPSGVDEAVAPMHEGKLTAHTARRSDRGHARTVTGVTELAPRF